MPKKNPRTEAVPSTLQEAAVYFADPDIALMYFVTLRWPDGEIACPTCGSKAVRFIATRRVWRCGGDHKRQQFSVKVGTIMEDSPIGLDKWMLAMWMLTNCKNGVSSYEIARALGITQKSAWFLNHRIRKAMQEGSFVTLGGSGKTVEVDETFIGGKARFMNAAQKRRASKGGHGTRGPYKFTGKAVVMGMLERGGKVVAKVVKTRHRNVVQPHIFDHVAPASQVMTDEHHAYAGLDERDDFEHKVIDHTFAYVDGQVHTNGIENFWSLLKRGIRGTYVSVEPFHLFRYLDEQMYRFNNRKLTDAGRFIALVRAVVDKRLTYKQLTGVELAGVQS
jgi:transposase-like protein